MGGGAEEGLRHGGGGVLAAAGRTCGGIGAAAAPAPSGSGGRFWRGHGRALVSLRAGAGRTAATKERRAAEKTERETRGGGGGGWAPPCRPTPEGALSRGRGRGPATAGPAGVGGGGAESVGIRADSGARLPGRCWRGSARKVRGRECEAARATRTRREEAFLVCSRKMPAGAWTECTEWGGRG